jgi:hypothetical protein
MGLSDDQKAMLRLLAQREQGYGDIAALTGQSVEDVRAKVKDAVAALDGPAAPAGDQRAILRLLAQREEGYEDIAALSGQSVAQVREKVRAALGELEGASASAATAAPPSDPTPVPPPEPEAKGPAAPSPVAKPAAPAATKTARAAKPKPGRRRTPKLPDDRGAVWGLGAGLAVVLILVILLATGALGGGGDGSSSETAATTAGGETTAAAKESLKPTQAVLKAVDGSDANGRALFGKAKDKVVLLVRAKGLDPAPGGQSYTVSLAKSHSERLPLVATQLNKKGELIGTFPIAPQVLGLLASGFDEMEVSLVANGELSAALKAAQESKAAPKYSGTDVLRGAVTGAIVEAGQQGKVNP